MKPNTRSTETAYARRLLLPAFISPFFLAFIFRALEPVLSDLPLVSMVRDPTIFRMMIKSSDTPNAVLATGILSLAYALIVLVVSINTTNAVDFFRSFLSRESKIWHVFSVPVLILIIVGGIYQPGDYFYISHRTRASFDFVSNSALGIGFIFSGLSMLIVVTGFIMFSYFYNLRTKL